MGVSIPPNFWRSPTHAPNLDCLYDLASAFEADRSQAEPTRSVLPARRSRTLAECESSPTATSAPAASPNRSNDLRAALARGDFAAAGLKKLAPTPYWRAKLSDEARLLMQFAPYSGETVCLFLEVIADHAYEKSRFLRGAPVDRDKIEAGPDDLRLSPNRARAGAGSSSGCRRRRSEFDLSTSRSFSTTPRKRCAATRRRWSSSAPPARARQP